MTDSTAPGRDYAADAAAELDKVRAYNEKRRELAAELATGKLSTAEIDAETADRSERLAAAYAALAAIGEGMISETGGYDVGVALQDLDVRFTGEDGGPGS